MPTRDADLAGLSTRALNRALLARQLLIERVDLHPDQAVERLVGMQAQQPIDPYLGLWTRLDPFDPEELSRLLAERAAVRGPFMRATLHLVTARDALALRPILSPALDHAFSVGSPFGRALAGVDFSALLETARAHLEKTPLTRAELGRKLAERWPDRDGLSLAYGVTYQLPIIQVTPRGLWAKTGGAR